MDRKEKILITTDGENWGEEVEKIANENKIEVYYIHKNGDTLLNAVREISPYIVCTEFFMPNLDALGVISNIKKERRALPYFIVTTEHTSPLLERELTTAGVKKIITSPFKKVNLFEQMVHIVQNKNNTPYNEDANLALKLQITEILHQIGVPAHIKGYDFLRKSIILAVNDRTIINSVTKRLYPEVAEMSGTSSTRVERAIRHAIEIAWDRGREDVFIKYFGYTIDGLRGKPTNSEFIAMISDMLYLQQGSDIF